VKKEDSLSSEVVFIGTELLLGEVLNTNSLFLSQELPKLGINCFFQSIVGDNKSRIKETLCKALQRADIVITTGGLGPTSDDLTHASIAELLGQNLAFCPEVYREIEKFIRQRGKDPVDSNKKQAFLPENQESYFLVKNRTGTAPGLIWDTKKLFFKDKKKPKTSFLITLPGVPREMKIMWSETVFHFLKKLIPSQKNLFWKEIKFYGISESKLAQSTQGLLDLEDPTVAPLADQGECKLRLATKSFSRQEAENKFKEIDNLLAQKFGAYIYSFNSETLEEVVFKLLEKQNLRLSLVESCTGGLISHRITQIPGSSKILEGSFIVYSKEAKNRLLKIEESFLDRFGLVSKEVCLEMAKQAQKILGADLSLGITGVLGPEKHDNQAVGKVYLSLLSKKKKLEITKELNLKGLDREHNKLIASQEALFLLFKTLSSF